MLNYLLILFTMYSFIGLACGIIAYTVSNILVYEDILNWYARFLNRLPEWLGKPLGLCSKCFAGQLALWVTLFFIISCFRNVWDLVMLPYPVCLAIYVTTKL